MTFILTTKNYYTFVPTNIVLTIMKIEHIIKSTIPFDDSKKVFLNFTYTQNVIVDKFNEILKPYDISREQYNVLRILRGQKGCPANLSVIQERMLSKNSNTTRLIDKLLLKDYVTREVCPNNRRKIEVLITQKGLDILYKLDPIVMEHEQFFANNLTKQELKQLNNLLEKYRTINK
jgi:DNA-binding MarR family transcriptional regulator